ncbi:MAG: hypothetical protein WKF30_13680 [Pyrinomonadaceae bacterium]
MSQHREARADIPSCASSHVRKNHLEIVAASTHPISQFQDQKDFDKRYELLVEEIVVARSLLISAST